MSSPKEGQWDRWAFERAVRDAEDLDGYEKAVAHNLLHHANSNGRAWPSADTIADETGWSPRKVRAARKTLEEKGWVERYGGHSSAGCTLCIPPAPRATNRHSVQPAQRATPLHSVPPGDAQRAGQPAQRATKQTKEQTKEQTKVCTPPVKPRVMSEEVERVIREVEAATKRILDTREAQRVVDIGPDLTKNIDAYLAVAGNYRNASPYKLAEWAADRLKRDAEQTPKKPKNALNRPDDDYGREVMERMLANATDVVREDT